ncbi:MAG: hypothetical protein ABWJ97_06750 [Thermoproteus sp.]
MWERIEEAIRAVGDESEYEKSIKSLAAKTLSYCRDAEGLSRACCLKLLIEIGIQLHYMRRFPPEERPKVFRRRGKRAVAFNISMLERSGLPGPYKRKVLRAYLKVSSYVHPSPEAASGEIPDDVVKKAVDVLIMLFERIK